MANNQTGNSNPNWPSKTGNPSGGGRGNNPRQVAENLVGAKNKQFL